MASWFEKIPWAGDRMGHKGRGKKIVLGLAGLFLVAQFIRPARTNPPTVENQTLAASVHVPPDAAAILKRSCGDCHSHLTRWPWYSNVAPVSWLVVRDVSDGRRHMDFSNWPHSNPARAGRLLGNICREVSTGDMPLWFYLPLHPSARLSQSDVKTLCSWTAAARQTMGLPATLPPRR